MLLLSGFIELERSVWLFKYVDWFGLKEWDYSLFPFLLQQNFDITLNSSSEFWRSRHFAQLVNF